MNDVTIEIIDALGQVILKTDVKHGIYTEGMAPGVYTIRATDQQGQLSWGKIAIK